MGADQGGEEDGLAPFYGGRKRDSHFRTCYQIQRLVAHKKTGAWAVGQHRIFLQFLY
jgi:hypothetical protein